LAGGATLEKSFRLLFTYRRLYANHGKRGCITYRFHYIVPLIHQRPARIARLDRRADLEIRASSPAPESEAISPLANFGAKPCKPMLGKSTVAIVPPAQFHHPAWGYGQRCNPPFRFEQRQIIGRVQIHHPGGNQTRAREQWTYVYGTFKVTSLFACK
jgi:hypothetical protein